MVSDELLQLMRCLETGSPLRRADADLCQRMNHAIHAGKIRNRGARHVDRPMDEALVNQEETLLYPIYNEVPQLLRDEAIELQQLESEVRGMGEKTIFKKIIDGEIPANIIHEDDQCLAFHDVNPQAPVHVLVIPKKEIASLDEVSDDDQALLGHMGLLIRDLASQLELRNGYRVVVNCGSDGGQEVKHLHYHLMGGRKLTWPPG